MRIDVAHLVEKIESPQVASYSDGIYRALEDSCRLIHRQESADSVFGYFSSVIDPIGEDEEARFVLDSLRHAFFQFAFGGLHDLYANQENESWYPRIVLSDVLEPNDIDSLEDVIVIFRGCSGSELATRSFGQSWSKSRDVAERFAFQHYSSQDWFAEEDRVVLQASCQRKNVLFSDQSEFGEFEVVVRADAIEDVQAAA